MKDKVSEIVLTGGPCSGKTTGLSYLSEKLRDRGWRVFLAPEVATRVIGGGVHDIAQLAKNNLDKYTRVELEMLLILLNQQKEINRLAAIFEGEKRVIVYDRGPMDIFSYLPDEMKNIFSDLHSNLTWTRLRDTFCDSVIHLVTAAIGAEKFYTTSNNIARYEDLEQARIADAKTLSAWMGCPHLKIIDNSTDFEGKMKRLLTITSQALGMPVPLEIERKFLLKRLPDFNDPHLKQSQKVSIEQMYLNCPKDEKGRLRIRKRTQNDVSIYYKTCKVKLRSRVRQETESSITERDYLQLRQFRDPRSKVIRKARCCFVYKYQYFELDIFLEPVQIIVLEIELTEENDKVELPPFLEIEKEVTDDSAYSNSAIAGV